MRTRSALAMIGLLMGVACSAPRPSPEASEGASVVGSDSLATTVEVQIRPGTVLLTLHVTNQTKKPVVLEFGTGQRSDFVVLDSNGAEVWRWSADRMFTQALGTETMAPGGSLKYEAEWRPGNRSGRFTGVGQVSATNVKLEQRTPFEIPPS